MKKLALFIVLFAVFISNAYSALLLKANKSSLCGPYAYERDERGQLKYLPIHNSNTFAHGQYIAAEEQKLQSFLQSWLDFFSNNGDSKLQILTLCYGYYNDEVSTGENAVAIGNHAILIGSKMMQTIKFDIDTYITNQFNYWNPGQKAHIQGIKSDAARDFLLLHEFAHFLQNTYQYQYPGKQDKPKELHADCIGASLFTLSKVLSNTWTTHDAMAGLMYSYALGDGNIKSSKHHGFPVERQNAFSIGMGNIINMKNQGIDLNRISIEKIMLACPANLI